MAEQTKEKTRLAGSGIAVRVALLTMFGLLGAVRIAAIKAAGLSGVPVHVVVSAAATGIAVFFTARAIVTADWPPWIAELLPFTCFQPVWDSSPPLRWKAPWRLDFRSSCSS